MYSLARGADNLLIGRFFGAAAVGLYTRGSILLLRPLEQLMIPIYTVLVPTLSRMQGQPDRYRRTFLQVFEAHRIDELSIRGPVSRIVLPADAGSARPKMGSSCGDLRQFYLRGISLPAHLRVHVVVRQPGTREGLGR